VEGCRSARGSGAAAPPCATSHLPVEQSATPGGISSAGAAAAGRVLPATGGSPVRPGPPLGVPPPVLGGWADPLAPWAQPAGQSGSGTLAVWRLRVPEGPPRGSCCAAGCCCCCCCSLSGS